MAANIHTGRTRIVRYCGLEYTVSAGVVYGKKQVWTVQAGETVIAAQCLTRSKALNRIHNHAVESGAFPAKLADGMTYSQVLSKLTN